MDPRCYGPPDGNFAEKLEPFAKDETSESDAGERSRRRGISVFLGDGSHSIFCSKCGGASEKQWEFRENKDDL